MRRTVNKSLGGKAWVVGDIKSDDLITGILETRGIVGDDEIQKFLNPKISEYMPDPFVLRDMDKAAHVIADAIVANKKIAIFGDYDVDGITSTTIFVKYLRGVGANVVWHLPTREGEGYGLNIDAIDAIADDGANLLITVDCGISGGREVAHAKSRGMSVVITDHHSPDGDLPDADAVVNPKRADDQSGLSYLAGVGVAFMTLVAVNRELNPVKKIDLMNFMDFVALGTICDTMPLVGLNRAFVATGLKVLNLRHNLGLRVLMEVAGVKKATTYTVMFALGPRLNAAGRLDSAAPVMDLLLTDNVLVANDLANKLNRMNQERIDIQNAIMIDASDMAQKSYDAGLYSIFVCGDNWRTGVMGIIAGRLKDKYNLPTCVATRTNGVIDGSGRSIADVDLGKIIHAAAASGIITGGGGHAAAAGFSLPAENEAVFCEFLENAVREQLDGHAPENEIVANAEMDAAGADMNLVNQLGNMEPFGQGNPEPVLVLTGATLGYATTMGKGGVHIRGTVNTARGQLNFVGFNMTGTPIGDFLLDEGNKNTRIKMLGKLKENEFNGRVSVQFLIEDVAV